MREDVRRRFVIGYTIEKRNMRLWYCSRSDILVTEQFNFTRVGCSNVAFMFYLLTVYLE